MVVSLLACRENYQQTGIRNRQMFPSVSKKCTIQLLGYSVEEAYCRLEFDFARVRSSRSDRKELPADEGFHIRRGSFSYGKKKTANVNSAGKVQLIIMFSFPIALSNKRSSSNRFAKVIENQTSPDFLLDVVTFAAFFFPYEKEPLLMWNPSSVGSSSLSDLDEQTLAKSNPRLQ